MEKQSEKDEFNIDTYMDPEITKEGHWSFKKKMQKLTTKEGLRGENWNQALNWIVLHLKKTQYRARVDNLEEKRRRTEEYEVKVTEWNK